MPFDLSIEAAKKKFPEFNFISRLTLSEQKAAFHVCGEDGRDLCLKVIAPNTSVERLEREIASLQRINHPNVVRFEDYVFSSKGGEQRHYILEEFVSGSDLTDLMLSAWKYRDAATFFSALASGLDALGRQSIVHRDLKPTNIRVRGDRVPVIIDFGVARLLDRSDLTATSHGARIGTPLYFAPEQFQGTRRDIDPRTDLFAFGVLLYHALVGEHPFWTDGMNFGELEAAVCGSSDFQKKPGFVGLPEAWKMLVSRLLEKQRLRRPNSASQVLDMLKRLESDA